MVKVPIPKGEIGVQRAQAALNRLYISYCVRHSRDHVSLKSGENKRMNDNFALFPTEKRKDHLNGLEGRLSESPATPAAGDQPAFRVASGGILTEICDTNETNDMRYKNMYRITQISNKNHILSKLIHPKASLSPVRSKDTVNKRSNTQISKKR